MKQICSVFCFHFRFCLCLSIDTGKFLVLLQISSQTLLQRDSKASNDFYKFFSLISTTCSPLSHPPLSVFANAQNSPFLLPGSPSCSSLFLFFHRYLYHPLFFFITLHHHHFAAFSRVDDFDRGTVDCV